MKKRWWILIIIAVILILIIPIKREANDGGTVEYSAVLYKVIKWDRIRMYEENKTGTEVYFFPKNLHSLEYYDAPRPENIAIYANDEDFVVANIGTYQWSKKVDGITTYINADAFGPLDMDYKETLRIAQGGSARISNLIANPSRITTYMYNDDEAKKVGIRLKYDETTQEINLSELNIGTYIIELLVKKDENTVLYSFKLEISDTVEADITDNDEIDTQTFYAKITKINNTNLLVDGLDVNDINYRGEFSFKVKENTKLEWRNTEIDISDLDEGDNISITFKGAVQESYPAGITDVVRIQLLDDEK